MSYVCGQPHAQEPDLLCNRTKPNHPEHSGYSIIQEQYLSWTNEAYVPTDADKKRVEKDADKAQGQALREIADRIRSRQ